MLIKVLFYCGVANKEAQKKCSTRFKANRAAILTINVSEFCSKNTVANLYLLISSIFFDINKILAAL